MMMEIRVAQALPSESGGGQQEITEKAENGYPSTVFLGWFFSSVVYHIERTGGSRGAATALVGCSGIAYGSMGTTPVRKAPLDCRLFQQAVTYPHPLNLHRTHAWVMMRTALVHVWAWYVCLYSAF